MEKVKPNRDGFFKIIDKLPVEYDLCIMVGKNGKTAMGWRTSGNKWDGHSIKRIDEVIAWKKAKEM